MSYFKCENIWIEYCPDKRFSNNSEFVSIILQKLLICCVTNEHNSQKSSADDEETKASSMWERKCVMTQYHDKSAKYLL